MKPKPQWISDAKLVFNTQSRKTIIVLMKLRRFPVSQSRVEFPEGYKINWIAYNEDDPNERVLFDNHHGKVLHYHIDSDQKGISFAWISREKTEALFWQKVQVRFGKLTRIW